MQNLTPGWLEIPTLSNFAWHGLLNLTEVLSCDRTKISKRCLEAAVKVT